MSDQKLSLTVFLLRSDQLEKVKQAFLADQTSFPLVPHLEGLFIPMPAAQRSPVWVNSVQSILQSANMPVLLGQSPAGLLLITRGTKTFAITFGHAWQQLKDEWLEIDFGRRVALNSIPRDQVVEIRAEQVFAKWHVANERAPRASSVDEFGVEFDRDLVGVFGGVPEKSLISTLGNNIRGGTSLKVTVPFNTLEAVLDKASVQFDSTAHKKTWPEIDTIMPITDPSLISQLEAQIDADIAAGKTKNKIVLFIPTRRNEDYWSSESYVFGRMSKYPFQTPYLTIDSWFSYLQKQNVSPSVTEARKTPIHVLDDQQNEFQAPSVFQCMGYETSLNTQPYILSGGVWYEVVASVLKKVNDTAKGMPLPKTNVVMWNPGEKEPDYNKRCATKNGFLLFDTKNIHYGGNQSKFEFCDFLDPKTKTLFFAKIATSSSGISHLVEQVRRTAELLFNTDGEYRAILKDVFKKIHPNAQRAWLDARPANHEWKLCMVSLGKDASKLPFFARSGVVRAYNELTRRGHLVSFVAA